MTTLDLTYNFTGATFPYTLDLPIPVSATITSINWGDGTPDTGAGIVSHEYAATGTYNVVITATGVTTFNYNSGSGQGYLTACTSFGTVGLQDCTAMFINCSNLTSVPASLPITVTNTTQMFASCTLFNSANVSSWVTTNVTNMNSMFNSCPAFNRPLTYNSGTGVWNTANVTNMSEMFGGATIFNQDITTWVTTNVTDMSGMFGSANAFNQDISGWNVTNVTLFNGMFSGANAFNQDISGWTLSTDSLKSINMGYMFSFNTGFNSPLNAWNTTRVTNMTNMFRIATAFNKPLNSWVTTNVINMSEMFSGATAFNGDITGWTTTNVTNMLGMFSGATAFNQDIGGWTTTSVQNLNQMFFGATAFDQDLSTWDPSSFTNVDGMFNESGLSPTNYNAILNTWSADTLSAGQIFGVTGLIYTSAGVSGRNALIGAPNNWSLDGDAIQSTSTITPGVPFSLTINYSGLTSGNSYQFYLDNPPTIPFSSVFIYTSGTLSFTNLTTSVSGKLSIYLYDVTGTPSLVTPFNNIYTSAAPPPPCFKEGSKILTDNGYKPIETLRKGDLVKTLKHGFVPVNMIGKRVINNPAIKDRVKEQLYKCSKEQYPEVFEDLIITGCHSILVGNTITHKQIEQIKEVLGNIYITDDKYRLPACVDDRTSVYENKGDFTIYHIALDNDDYYMNYGVYANGLLVETCSKRYLKELSKMELI